MQRPRDWFARRRVPLAHLRASYDGAKVQIRALRRILKIEGKFRNPLIVRRGRRAKQYIVIIGNNRLAALLDTGSTDAVDVIVVVAVEGIRRALEECYSQIGPASRLNKSLDDRNIKF